MTTVHVPEPLPDDPSPAHREPLTGVVLSGNQPDIIRSWGPLVTDWLDAYDASTATKAGYSREARLWNAWCESRGLDPLNARRRDIDQYAKDRRAAGDAPRTLARRLSALSSLYSYAASSDVVPANPAKNVRRPKVNRRHSPSQALTAGQGHALLAAAREDSPRSAALVALLLYQGLRISEALAADIEHLGWHKEHRVLTVTSKGGGSDTIPLALPTRRAVDAAINGRTTGPILATSTNKPMDRRHAHRTVQRLAKAAGIPDAEKIGPHDLRHTAITGVLMATKNLDAAQGFARHADPRTTKLYDHREQDLDNHAAYQLMGFYQPDAP